MTTQYRKIAGIVTSHRASPAPGIVVQRPFPGPEIDQVSPFIMLDHFGPTRVAPGERGELHPHPHRGFETVTVLFDGALEHYDSLGNHGVLKSGAVQWMTAARGIVHAEYNEREFAARGGFVHGVQLWVNLPARHKMDDPHYQDLAAARIPVVPVGQGVVRVIAGAFGGVNGAARTHTPITLLHAALKSGDTVTVPVAPGHDATVYVVRGEARVAGTSVATHQLAVLGDEGEALTLEATADCDLLILAGEPIDEPVVSWGPFVMNTREEIVQARIDYGAGRMGTLEIPA